MEYFVQDILLSQKKLKNFCLSVKNFSILPDYICISTLSNAIH